VEGLKDDFNAPLAKLRASGIISSYRKYRLVNGGLPGRRKRKAAA